MLSNPLLQDRKIFEIIPVEVLVVDEASQIEIGEYMVSVPSMLDVQKFIQLQHLFHKFKALRKTCFFGDPKQR